MESVYKKMYYHLFNAVTDAIASLETENTTKARWLLMAAQQKCEDFYLESEEDDGQ